MIQFEHYFGLLNENMNQNFRFNNPKQCSNWIILVSFCSSHLAIKNCYNVHFMKIEKIDAKIDFSAKNSKKFVYYNEELVHKCKFQTQLSRKLQRFRTCRKNKKCSIFHDLSEYIIFSYGCKLLDWSFNKRKRDMIKGPVQSDKSVHNLGIDSNETKGLKRYE